MAETWQLNAREIAPGNGKSMLGILNGAGSGKVIRVYRMWMLNNFIGVPYSWDRLNLEIRAITGLTVGSGAAVTPVKHDTANAALDANVVMFTGGTVSGESATLIRLLGWSENELTVGASIDAVEALIPLGVIWDTGYGSTVLQPLTLREGEGVHIKCTTDLTVGTMDIRMEFTQSSS